ncbi:MAG TPA: CdaR family protein [Thermoanaerobaculia bacterium]|jgi:YbbR domain-containing protein|nr:CdaR family protein [Thermoanaerobaculia bacterium]
MKNIGLKLVSLLLACILWWYVSLPRREEVRERVVNASLTLVGMPSSLVITTADIPSSVAVRVRGRKSDLRAVASQTLEATADLSGITQPGEVKITIRARHINVPDEIEVVSILPPTVSFRVEQLRQRAVPIRPYLEGTTPAGFIVGQASADPALALVSGPASQITKLAEVTTERIIMTGRTETFVQSVGVIADSTLVRVISPLTTQVTVPVLAEVGPEPPTATDTAATTETTGTQ